MKPVNNSLDLGPSAKVLLHSMGLVLGFIYGFIDTHVWNPAYAYFLVMSLVLVDFGTGLLYSLRTSAFSARKAQHVIYTMIAYTVLLFYSHQFSKLGGFMPLLTHVVFVPMVLVTMYSLVQNFGRLGWLPKKYTFALNQKLESKLKEGELNIDAAASEPILPAGN